jgi:O-antigen ligase
MFPIVLIISVVTGVLLALDPYYKDNYYIYYVFSKHINILNIFFYEIIALLLLSLIIAPFLMHNILDKIFHKRHDVLLILLVLYPQLKSMSMGVLDLADLFILPAIIFYFFDYSDSEVDFLKSKYVFWLLMMLLSIFLSSSNGGIGSFKGAIAITKSSFYYFILIIMVSNYENFYRVLRIFFISIVASSLLAILQEFLYLFTGKAVVGNISSDALSLMIEKTSIAVFLRTPAMYGSPQAFSNMLSFAIPVIGAYSLFENDRRILGNRYIAISCCAVTALALILTFSRGSWIGAMFGAIIFLVMYESRYLIHYAALLLLGGVVSFVTGVTDVFWDEIYSQLKLGGDLSDRVFLANDSLVRLGRHPLLGVGFLLGRRYTGSAMGWPAHNGFILVLVELGFIGFIVFLGLFIKSIVDLLAMFTRAEKEIKLLAAALMGGVLGFMVQIQFDPNTVSPGFLLMVALVAGATSVFHPKYGKVPPSVSK